MINNTKFCEEFDLQKNSNKKAIKEYILNNIHTMLFKYLAYTFDCPIIYYNEKNDNLNLIKLINKEENINWNKQDITFTRASSEIWKTSTTVKICNQLGDVKAIGEFEIHNNRDGIVFRWHINTLLGVFSEYFKVYNL